jgi:hypothetical protein
MVLQETVKGIANVENVAVNLDGKENGVIVPLILVHVMLLME